MAENDKSISQLAERTELTGNEMIPFAEGGQNGSVKSSLLKGQKGDPGEPGTPGAPGAPFTYADFTPEQLAALKGEPGADGKSAYQLAVEAGYTGTEAELSALLAGLPEQAKDMQELKGQVKDLYEEIAKDRYTTQDFCVGAWTDGDLSPTSTETYGDPEILRKWDFLLIDTTDNTGTTTTPVGTYRKNNLLRFEDGTFAPAVAITEAQRAQCDVALYLDNAGTQKYCDALDFDAEAFYNEYGMTQKLYDAEGTEIGHILRPWETTETKYTIGLGRRETVYLLDNVKGNSGKVWKGIFLKPAIWDGIDVSAYPLAPTALSPCPVTTVGGKTRNFFYLYEGETNCKGSAGQNGLCTMFLNGRTYPRTVDVQQVSLMNYARANNADGTLPYPFAEGGYHALNTYLTCQEVLHGTKYLHNAALFGSGISSNDACNSEATWLANGGVRYRLAGSEAWTYCIYLTTGNIYYSATARTNFNAMLNSEYAKEQCMESQLAASFAQETGVAEGEEFEFYGATYWYKNVPGAKGLSEGDMNVRVYKKMAQTFSAFDSTGAAVDWEVEVVLRMSLLGGMNYTGDIYAYVGGGCEAVGTSTDAMTGTKGHPVALYMEPDQTKWMRETTFTKDNFGTFDFETVYPKVADVVNLGDGSAAKRQSYTPWKILIGGNLATGECFHTWDNKHWSNSLHSRTRIALRFRVYAHYTYCAGRSLYASNAASHANRHSGGFAQAAVSPGAAEDEEAPPEQEES